jgi:flavin-dependent dehydrogenase
MPDLYDAIIVGAGPGGATAAYFLGEAGKRVLVLEKETLPRYKPVAAESRLTCWPRHSPSPSSQ